MDTKSQKCFGINVTTRNMTHKLGKWFPEVHLKYNKWKCYYDQITYRTFHDNGNAYDTWISNINRTGTATLNITYENIILQDTTETCIPAELNINRLSKTTTFFKQSPPTQREKSTKENKNV